MPINAQIDCGSSVTFADCFCLLFVGGKGQGKADLGCEALVRPRHQSSRVDGESTSWKEFSD